MFHPLTTCNRNPSITEAWKICTFSSHEKQVKIWLVLASINLPSSPRLLNPFLCLSSQPCCIVYIHCHLMVGNDECISSSCAQFWMLPFFSHCCDLIGRKCLFLCRLTILGDYFLVVGRYNSCRGRHGSGNSWEYTLYHKQEGETELTGDGGDLCYLKACPSGTHLLQGHTS